MHPKADEFILDVRRAARLELKPTVATDSQLIDPDFVADVLRRATLWLTPKITEAYDPAAFSAWPEALRIELQGAVDHFRRVAAAVPSGEPATFHQRTEGVRAFARLKAAAREVALSEWLGEAGALVNRVESWAQKFEWPTRRRPKKLNEILLGEYELDQLYMHAEGDLYLLDPVARFNPGGLGAFDLSIQPSFHFISVYRHTDGVWCVRLDADSDAPNEPLSPDALRRAVARLRSLP